MIAAMGAGIDVRGKCFAMTSLLNGDLLARLRRPASPCSSRRWRRSGRRGRGMILDRAVAAGLSVQLPIRFAEKRV